MFLIKLYVFCLWSLVLSVDGHSLILEMFKTYINSILSVPESAQFVQFVSVF